MHLRSVWQEIFDHVYSRRIETVTASMGINPVQTTTYYIPGPMNIVSTDFYLRREELDGPPAINDISLLSEIIQWTIQENDRRLSSE